MYMYVIMVYRVQI